MSLRLSICGLGVISAIALSFAPVGNARAGDDSQPIEFSNPSGSAASPGLNSPAKPNTPNLDLNAFPQSGVSKHGSFSSMNPLPPASNPTVIERDHSADIFAPLNDGSFATPQEAMRNYMTREILKLPEFGSDNKNSASGSSSGQNFHFPSASDSSTMSSQSFNPFASDNSDSPIAWTGSDGYQSANPFVGSGASPSSLQAVPDPASVVPDTGNISEIFGLTRPDSTLSYPGGFSRSRPSRLEQFRQVLEGAPNPAALNGLPANPMDNQTALGWNRTPNALDRGIQEMNATLQNGMKPIFGTVNADVAPTIPNVPSAPLAPGALRQAGTAADDGIIKPSAPTATATPFRPIFDAPQRRF